MKDFFVTGIVTVIAIYILAAAYKKSGRLKEKNVANSKPQGITDKLSDFLDWLVEDTVLISVFFRWDGAVFCFCHCLCDC